MKHCCVCHFLNYSLGHKWVQNSKAGFLGAWSFEKLTDNPCKLQCQVELKVEFSSWQKIVAAVSIRVKVKLCYAVSNYVCKKNSASRGDNYMYVNQTRKYAVKGKFS